MTRGWGALRSISEAVASLAVATVLACISIAAAVVWGLECDWVRAWREPRDRPDR